MRVLIGIAVIVLAVLAVAALALPSSADDAPGCDGLAEYREAMLSLPLPIEADDNAFTMSSSDWLAYAESSLEFHDLLADVTPPEWAADWHEARLDAFGFREQLGRMVAENGVMVLLGFDDTVNDLIENSDKAEASAIDTCPDFAAFAYEWDALDGDVDGTPVATPIR